MAVPILGTGHARLPFATAASAMARRALETPSSVEHLIFVTNDDENAEPLRAILEGATGQPIEIERSEEVEPESGSFGRSPSTPIKENRVFLSSKPRSSAPTFKQFEIAAPRIARKQKPGQFVIIRVHENGERIRSRSRPRTRGAARSRWSCRQSARPRR